MEIITNNFLQRITLSPIDSLYEDSNERMKLDDSKKLDILKQFEQFENLAESEKFKEFEKLEEIEQLKKLDRIKIQDENLNNKSVQTFLDLFSTNLEIKKLLTDAKSDEEKKVIIELISLHFYFSTKNEVEPRLKSQLRQLNNIINSDICIRNKKLKNEAIIEAEKLKMAIDTDWVYYAINRLDQLYMHLDTSLNKTNRYIQISETMHYLSLYSRERFYTLEEATDYVKRKDAKKKPYLQTPKTFIKDRIKLHIWEENKIADNQIG